MSKLIIISLVAILTVVNARVLDGDVDVKRDIGDIPTNDIAPVEKEGRTLGLIAFPSVATIILKSLKAAWFLLTTLCSVIDFKMGALALVANAGLWLLSFKFPILLGAGLIFGLCKLTGLCAFGSIFTSDPPVPDHLAYAADYLDMGTMKYDYSKSA